MDIATSRTVGVRCAHHQPTKHKARFNCNSPYNARSLSKPISVAVFINWSSDLLSATSIGVASKAIGWLNTQAGALHCLLKQQTRLTLTS